MIAYVAGMSKEFKKIFNKNRITAFFKPSNTLRQKCLHPNDSTPKYKQGNLVYAVKSSEDFKDLYMCGDKTNKQVAQHRRTNSTAVFLHFKEKGHSFEDSEIYNLNSIQLVHKRC